jgi:hypothetical protein
MKPERGSKPLKPAHRELLREVIERQAPQLSSLLPRANLNALLPNERTQLCDLIVTEFMQTGRRPDDEPNPRGLKLEELLDEINRPNLVRP